MDQTSGLTFELETHTYRLGDVLIPSVTQVIDGLLTDFSCVPSGVLRRARELGTAVHLACELHDRGTLDYGTVDPAIWPYLEAWMRFLSETKCKIQHIERLIHSAKYHYAGTLDRLAEIGGRPVIIDLKTGSLGAQVGVQLAAYAEAARESGVFPHRRLPAERYAVQLRDDGSYRTERYGDPSDFSMFLCCLNIHTWRIRHVR